MNRTVQARYLFGGAGILGEMANVNKVVLIGRTTQDIEVRSTGKGTAVTSLNLAVNRSHKNSEGESIEETTFVEVVRWGRTAELAGRYLSKGREVYIEGRLQLQEWEDKQTGKKRQMIRVVGENMQFIGGKPDGASRQSNEPDPGEKYRIAAGQAAPKNLKEDEIPF